ncbi:MAG: AmmeMemoRadiSam system protein A [Desulfobacterales bacterium]|nr:AmmeMemoRadiSam system protein A [Desulfobacterales bacterium]
MSDFSDEEKKSLLILARSSIESKIVKGAAVKKPENPSPLLMKKMGCFVTLHKSNNLRGCIGNIEPVMPLILGVEENALNAAFHDPRFPKLSKSELPLVNIEISVLTTPEDLKFKDLDDLKQKLKPHLHGVILSKGFRKATFLPQVWEQLPTFESFLSHLCLKAGMSSNCWQDKSISIQVYEAKYFGE